MTYSCTDFTDSILDALKIEVPEEFQDSPEDQADLALAEVDRLQESEKAFTAALGLFATMPDDPERSGAHMTGMRVTFAELRQVKAALAGVPVLPVPMIVALYENRYGDEMRLFRNSDDARAWRREIAAENWNARMDGDKPTDADEMADRYFEIMGEARGDFFRTEELEMPGAAGVSPGTDWRAIAQDLAGALSSCTHQIGQMDGMFSDDDGTIAEALSDADAAMAVYSKACKIAPDAPTPATVAFWTLTTDGDNCPLTTSVHTSEADAMESVRNVLSDDCSPEILTRLGTMTADELSEAWGATNDGACIIERHELPIASPASA